MYSSRRKFLVRALRALDAGAMCLCFVIAGLAHFSVEQSGVGLREFWNMRIAIPNFFLFAGLLCLWSLIFGYFGLYRSGRMTRWFDEFINILVAVSIGTMLIAIASFVFRIDLVSRYFLIVFWLAAVLMTVGSRLLLRLLLRQIRIAGRNIRHIVIVGTNDRAIEVARQVEADPHIGFSVNGFVDDDWHGIEEVRNSGYRIVTDFAGFRDYLQNNVVDEVFICAPLKSLYDRSSNLLAQCEEQGINVHFDEQIFNQARGRIYRESWGGRGWVTFSTGAVRGPSVIVKRVIDVVVSATLLSMLAPFFLVIAVMIKRDSPGPVFFIQDRVGLGKRVFPLYKFRTMKQDAESTQNEFEQLNEVDGPVFKMKNDPRVTQLGKFLRRTSIDELPQLMNVLKGDMTLVGPRPLPIRDYEGFSEDWYRRRFSVRPGLTCLWQIEGRSNISFDRWMELDMEYIDQWSIWLDLRILAKTIPVVLRGSGAY